MTAEKQQKLYVQRRKKGLSEFVWIPGQGPSLESLKNMAAYCPKPKEAMGEAWFLGEKRFIFSDLMCPDVENLPHSFMRSVFFEMSGLESFGKEDNWDSWFYYLLWYLLEKEACTCGEILEFLISASFIIQNTCPERPYKEYSDDLTATLAQGIMSKKFWNDDDLSREAHRRGPLEEFPACTGALSASMFLCLELLSVDQFDSWLDSILRIEGIFWKANILCWFVSAHQLVFEPKLFGNVDRRQIPSIDWEHDYLIKEPFVRCNKTKLATFFEKLREQLDLQRFLIWMEPLYDDKSIAEAFAVSPVVERYSDFVLTNKKY